MKKVFFIGFAFAFYACGSQATTEASTEKKEVLSGKEVYSIYCVACHGADGKLAFSGATDLSKSELDLETRILQITHGKGVMNAFKNVISPEEIENVALYIEELRK
ncbi:MAG: cytochrome c [Chitinophagales bacterium]|nr:cytochrome c [Chitinophagales bacterium]